MVSTKRVYDPAAHGDGTRVLVMKYWPRGSEREKRRLALMNSTPSRRQDVG